MLLKNSVIFNILDAMVGQAYDPYDMTPANHVTEEYYTINKFYPEDGVAITMMPTGEMEMAAYTDRNYGDFLFYGGVDAMITTEHYPMIKCTRFDLI